MRSSAVQSAPSRPSAARLTARARWGDSPEICRPVLPRSASALAAAPPGARRPLEESPSARTPKARRSSSLASAALPRPATTPHPGAAPQGGGTTPCGERAVFTAVVYVLISGCAWRHRPPTFGTFPATHIAGSQCGPRRACGSGCTGRCWTDSAPGARWTGPRRSSMRRPSGRKRGTLTGPNPVGRGKKAANCMSCPTLRASRWLLRCPGRICTTVKRSGRWSWRYPTSAPGADHADGDRSRSALTRHPMRHQAYYSADHLTWLRARGLIPRIARPWASPASGSAATAGRSSRRSPGCSATAGSPSDTNRKGSHFLALLGLAAALTCYKKLAELTT